MLLYWVAGIGIVFHCKHNNNIHSYIQSLNPILNILKFKVARLDFLGGYLPRLSINYVDMSKDMGKRLPQLYYIMMKISYDLGFIAIGVAMAT